MSAAELLAELNRRGVELWAEGERLRYRAPQGTLTPDLRERLAAAREQLLAALTGGESRAAEAVPTLPTVVPDPERRHEPFPLTDLQQAYWLGYSSLFELGGVAPHVYAEYDQQDLDFERLERAWQRLVERHEMLRAVIQPDGRQRILPTVPPYRIQLTDLRSLPAPEAEAQLLAVREEMCHQGPRLDAWPPFEIRAFRLGDSHIRLCWSLALTICDDWSFHVLTEEWRLLYGDPTAALPPLALSFRDYVLGLAEFESTAAWRRSLDYWRERLADLPPAPQLPLARDPAGIDAPRFTRQTRRFGRELWRRFEASARRVGVTPSAALCSVYAEVLATWSHKRRFTLNLLFFNRSPVHPQIEQVVGNFSSTVLLAVDCATPGSFAERAARLQQQLWRDLQHSAVSGIRVLRELGRARGGSARAAVPVVFASNLNTGFDEQETSGRGLGSSFNHLQTAHVWLDHQVFLLQGELILNWDVVQGLFPDGLPEVMFSACCELLERLATVEEAWHEQVRGLVPGEQIRLREQINATEVPLSDRRLHELFEAQARSLPDATAVVSTDRRLSYAELGARATWIARHLQEEGAVPNSLVAVAMEKGWEQVVATLGILGSGAAYLPIDPALPPERFRYLLEHGRVRVALTQSRLAGRLPWPDGVRLFEIDREPAAAGEEPLPPAAGLEDLAYVIFTSGSTGLPKGVMIDHRGAVNTILDVNRRFAVGKRDRVFALSSLSFDLSVYDFFGMLAAGGTLVLPAAADQRDPERWLQILRREEITVWNSVPALMQMLVDHVESTGDRLPPSLRLVLLSGDWIPLTLPDRIRALAPAARVISLGGATEASIWSILYPIDRIDPAWPSVPYGRPMENQTFWVLDEALENRPVWVPGDLYIGGVGLAKGYWRDEEKTRASFLVHPRTGERLYRTGDLGRYLPGGDIEFLGREDFQVKVQGYRIELGEIEAALCRHPAVQQAVVTATGDAQRGRRLVGYVVPAADPPPEPAALRAFLLERLPEYMVPMSMVNLRELPLTANGKVDRSALPVPGEVRRDGAAGFVAPRDSFERELARIWSELLASGPVGIGDNFFDLGGHSVLVVQLARRVKQAFGRDLPMAALLERPTLEHLAETLRGGAASPTPRALVPLHTAGARPPLFCLHPSGGSVFCYRELSRALGGDQPVYGLQTPGLEDDRELVARVEDMAASYLGEIASVQPHGPYFLAGWSMGGIVAFEMARQLQGRGEDVALVVLVDTVAAPHGTPPDDAELTSWFARDLSGLAASPPMLTGEALRPLDPEARIERLLDWARETGFLAEDGPSPGERANGGGQEVPTAAELQRFLRRRLPGVPLPADFVALPAFPMTPEGHIDRRALERRADPPPPPRAPGGDDAGRLRRLLGVFTTNFQAMLTYVPGSYPGRVALLKARDGLGKGHPDPTLGWGRVAPDLILHELAGDHYTLLQPPHVATLAATLAGWLERAGA